MRHSIIAPARVLAERVGISESAVLRRLRLLRANGTIAADISIGLPLSIHMFVSLERETGGELDGFIRKVREVFHDGPNVKHFRTLITIGNVVDPIDTILGARNWTSGPLARRPHCRM